MRHANFSIVEVSENHVLIRDLGPWDQYPTVTNDAEAVVRRLVAQGLDDRKLYCIDSEGETDELLVKGGQFAGFAPCPKTQPLPKGKARVGRTRIVEAEEEG